MPSMFSSQNVQNIPCTPPENMKSLIVFFYPIFQSDLSHQNSYVTEIHYLLHYSFYIANSLSIIKPHFLLIIFKIYLYSLLGI